MQKNISSFFQRQPPPNIESSSSTSKPLKIVLDDLPWDPSERKPISSYHPSQKDEIRRTYLLRGPCQPKGKKTDFPQTLIGNSDKLRRFNPKWYTEKHGNWLEYSVKADKVYCLYCYLFKESGQKDAFASEGVQCWHRKEERFEIHVGKSNSFHNRAVQKGEDLLKEAQSIPAVQKKPEQNKEYRIRLSTSVILAKGLLNGGLPFRGHDESEASLYRGHFIEFLKLFEQINEEIAKYILSNAPKNCQMTAPSIQKDICNCFAEEVLKMIFEELGDDVFSLLVDESRDISKKEQMAVVLRFVDKLGFVKERYIGVVHVMETTALSLKSAIDELFAHRNLNLGRVRGQGYDGASNMSGEFNGLKTLILKENSSAYYVHCFAHQLQLVVVALANKHLEICRFFKEITDLINVVGASCKRIDLLRESQRELLALNPEVVIGSGNNQEMALTRPGDTRWSSHEKTLLRLLTLYPCVIEVLEYIETSAWEPIHKTQANGLQLYMKSFKFVFYLHLMKHILGVTNLLCVALQRKNQDILNAVELVRSTKEELQRYRLEGFDSLLKDVTSFCDKYDIEMINMEDEYVDPKNRRRKTNITNRHHFVVNNFNTVLDMQIQELGNRFNEVTTNLLTCMSSLSPHDNFSSFNKLNLLKLAEMYPYDFTFDEKDKLIDELGHYISNMKRDSRFDNLNGVSDLAKRMVETRKHIEYQLVYRLIKLSLVLPVATASVERSFSSMKLVKTELRNRMGDGYMNDSCICYIEKEFLQQVSVESVMQRFQKKKTRRQQL
ncbi:putative transcription factor and/or regulators TTF-type(Zn) family [Helianthus annuus]|uniref:zinc finger MYM-type protein 1-like n=1 Tax=Helianthus annuus TaxID=4232 RepID=UPI001653316E|nr:zinc finger MYM-type protein 1-like [Helianthus annuus]XP_035836376.1 zinc finger MYM-type protein 1-like [Helianthus annuus]XP_035836377.1 zinc finger MYM-type protein 1-like [Helianthus annuus]XP_035836378.1 zinc finger MYM-type protein 1-like [Helianthus annuus]XP_035836379.1 zinc finger MYM-type protein 1-like [Helianthus annuus]XP_035836380.1 zinc finger MYM-type protein 1-like [Helianthus annuus]XP_035836381.1 zinc finger MYM-type protein 1-like [Helianthus annuus]XP_035836382.1 zin